MAMKLLIVSKRHSSDPIPEHIVVPVLATTDDLLSCHPGYLSGQVMAYDPDRNAIVMDVVASQETVGIISYAVPTSPH